MYYIYILVLLLNCGMLTADMTFQDPRFLNRTLPTAQLFNKYDTSLFEPFSGQMIYLNATSSFDGYIVYVRDTPKANFWRALFDIQNQGAIAIVFNAGSRVPGRAYCTYNGEDFFPDLVIPIVRVSRRDFDKDFFPLLQQGEILNITLTPGGNDWYDTFTSAEFTGLFRAFMGILSSALVVYAVVVLAIFIKAQGSKFNIPQVCLGLEIIANLLRLVYLAADPFGCFFTLQSVTSNILESISLPLNVATFVLITFFWYEAITDASIRIYSFLSKLKIPFFVLTFTLIAVDFMFSFLDYYKGVNDQIPLLVIYLVISGAFLIFYIVTVVKIAKRMQLSAEMSGSKTKRRVSYLMQINKRIILNAVGKIVLITYAIIWAALSSDTDTPVQFAVKWEVLFLVLIFDSFCRIYLFNAKQVVGNQLLPIVLISALRPNTRHCDKSIECVSIVPNPDLFWLSAKICEFLP